MTKQELLDKLKECAKSNDREQRHIDADIALLEFINDLDVTVAYNAIARWYA